MPAKKRIRQADDLDGVSDQERHQKQKEEQCPVSVHITNNPEEICCCEPTQPVVLSDAVETTEVPNRKEWERLVHNDVATSQLWQHAQDMFIASGSTHQSDLLNQLVSTCVG